MTTVQFILLILVAAIAGMGSVLDEAQFHRPLVACTLVGSYSAILRQASSSAVHLKCSHSAG